MSAALYPIIEWPLGIALSGWLFFEIREAYVTEMLTLWIALSAPSRR